MTLEEIKKDFDIVNSINWEMTPEEAIALHLEWGPLRDLSYYNSRDNDNETVYFVISTWKKPPTVRLVRRRGFDSEELSEFRMPTEIENRYVESMGKFKGVFAVEGEVRDWLRREIGF